VVGLAGADQDHQWSAGPIHELMHFGRQAPAGTTNPVVMRLNIHRIRRILVVRISPLCGRRTGQPPTPEPRAAGSQRAGERCSWERVWARGGQAPPVHSGELGKAPLPPDPHSEADFATRMHSCALTGGES